MRKRTAAALAFGAFAIIACGSGAAGPLPLEDGIDRPPISGDKHPGSPFQEKTPGSPLQEKHPGSPLQEPHPASGSKPSERGTPRPGTTAEQRPPSTSSSSSGNSASSSSSSSSSGSTSSSSSSGSTTSSSSSSGSTTSSSGGTGCATCGTYSCNGMTANFASASAGACVYTTGQTTITLECGGKITSGGMSVGTWAQSGSSLVITVSGGSPTTCTKTGG